jgi:DNA-binding MarR family transcriptional regulator
MAAAFDIGEFMSCSCLRLRRVAREATRLYDGYLEPIGLGSNQLILMVTLHGAGRGGASVTARALAERIGSDPTTLSRNLQPLIKRGLIAAAADPEDGRSRLLRITAKGEAKLREAGPLWRKAQARVKAAVGAGRLKDLHGLLDHATANLGNQL